MGGRSLRGTCFSVDEVGILQTWPPYRDLPTDIPGLGCGGRGRRNRVALEGGRFSPPYFSRMLAETGLWKTKRGLGVSTGEQRAQVKEGVLASPSR